MMQHFVSLISTAAYVAVGAWAVSTYAQSSREFNDNLTQVADIVIISVNQQADKVIKTFNTAAFGKF